MDSKKSILTLCIAFAIFIGFAAATVAASDSYSYTLTNNWSASGSGPTGITIGDSAENIYVTLTGSNKIVVFNQQGVLVTGLHWGTPTTGPKQLNRPRGITAGKNENIYVVDTGNNRVVMYSSHRDFISAWGSLGAEEGNFTNPCGITTDTNGNVYVADTGNNRIQVFDPDGKLLKAVTSDFNHPEGIVVSAKTGNIYVADTGNDVVKVFDSAWNAQGNPWGGTGSGDGQFIDPKGITIEYINDVPNVFVADTGNSRFQEFDPEGKYLGKSSPKYQFVTPVGIVIDTNRNIFVTDETTNLISEFTSTPIPVAGVTLDYNYVREWGTPGTGSNQFNQPTWIAEGINGTIYVVDNQNSRVEEFSSLGTFIRQWGIAGRGQGQFSDPKGIAIQTSPSNIGKQGNVWVVDAGNSRIQEFDRNGKFISQWGSPGSGNGQFFHPEGITVDPNGEIFVVDSGNSRIQEFSPLGVYQYQWGSHGSGEGQFNAPLGITIGSDGLSIYVVDSGNSRIQRFAKINKAYTTFEEQWGSQGSGQKQFINPRGIVTGTNGNIYVVDSGNNRIQEFTPLGGTYIGEWGSYGYGNYQAAKGKFNKPTGITVGTNGNIYVADSGNNRIEQFYSTWPYVSQWGSLGVGRGQFFHPSGITVYPGSGNIYAVDTGNNRVEVFTPTGAFVNQWGSWLNKPRGVNDKFNKPTGITVANANIYVVDSGNDRVVEFKPDGTYIGEWESFGHGDNMFIHAEGIASDGTNLYVVDSGNYRVVEFTSTGTYITQWGSQGSKDGQFGYPGPSGIMYDTINKQVYVVDYGNNRIQVFTSDGKFVNKWGSSGSGNGQFYYPEGIAMDTYPATKTLGNVYVVDRGNNRIQYFTPDGTYQTQWGAPGKGDGLFAQPNGIATFGDGSIYVTDTNNNRVQKFSLVLPPPIPATPTPIPTLSPTILKANFIANQTTGGHPFSVQFTDLSTGNPGSYLWTFGDGNTSILKNPINKYSKKGVFTVSLKVSNSAGTNSLSRSYYIIVT